MTFFLNEPSGLWALLGVPAILLIHFLQRKSQTFSSTTLFLLKRAQPQSSSGKRFERLTPSIPLWLQLLLVLFISWILTDPKFQSEKTILPVAIVLDSSASMQVHHNEALITLKKKLEKIDRREQEFDLQISESSLQKDIIYRGNSLEEALIYIQNWQPTMGATDPTDALMLARSRLQNEGLLIYLTDHLIENLPYQAQLLAVGAPTSNVGFTGVSSDSSAKRWEVLIRNYSDEEQVRTWTLRYPDGSSSPTQEITLSPREIKTISAEFPTQVETAILTLSGDLFSLDDHIPLLLPQPKALSITNELSSKMDSFYKRLTSAIPHLKAQEKTDLRFLSYDPLMPFLIEGDALVFIDETSPGQTYLKGGILAASHPLMEGLNWQSLSARETISIPVENSDQVLLWQGEVPLIFLREGVKQIQLAETNSEGEPVYLESPYRQLIFNFDPALSNAERLPAMIILIQRFIETVRLDKVRYEATLTETQQAISIPLPEEAQQCRVISTNFSFESETETFPLEKSSYEMMNESPRFTKVFIDEQLLYQTASYFADCREADLSQCASNPETDLAPGKVRRLDVQLQQHWVLFALILFLILFLNWYFLRPKRAHDL